MEGVKQKSRISMQVLEDSSDLRTPRAGNANDVVYFAPSERKLRDLDLKGSRTLLMGSGLKEGVGTCPICPDINTSRLEPP